MNYLAMTELQLYIDAMVDSFYDGDVRLFAALDQLALAVQDESVDRIYPVVEDISGQIERLCNALLRATIIFYSDLQCLGLVPLHVKYPHATDVDISLENDSLIVKLPAILPFRSKGSVYYLHEQLAAALEKYWQKYTLPKPLFRERVAVVFLHHYSGGEEARNLRDYDNVEHRCILNALAFTAIGNDNPRSIIMTDILATGDHNFTEIRIMPVSTYCEFVQSDEFSYDFVE